MAAALGLEFVGEGERAGAGPLDLDAAALGIEPAADRRTAAGFETRTGAGGGLRRRSQPCLAVVAGLGATVSGRDENVSGRDANVSE